MFRNYYLNLKDSLEHSVSQLVLYEKWVVEWDIPKIYFESQRQFRNTSFYTKNQLQKGMIQNYTPNLKLEDRSKIFCSTTFIYIYIYIYIWKINYEMRCFKIILHYLATLAIVCRCKEHPPSHNDTNHVLHLTVHFHLHSVLHYLIWLKDKIVII